MSEAKKVHNAFPVKRTPDGRALLNLACGTRMHRAWNNIDFSVYARLAPHPQVAGVLRRIGVLSPLRSARLQAIDPDIVRYDLYKGIPFADRTFDVVYHSHFLEHVPAGSAQGILDECFRVLRPQGRLRVVVPDLEIIARRYVDSVQALDQGEAEAQLQHSRAIHKLFDQMVRVEPVGRTEQKALVAVIERLVRGSAHEIGETHRWMYDRYSLRGLLAASGFIDIAKKDAFASDIPDWSTWALDVNGNGSVYKSDSLYMESVRPGLA